MQAEYSITPDPFHGALRVVMGGFFQQEDVESFVREVHAKLSLLRTAPNQHLMLCDVRRMKIQAQDIVAAFTRIVGSPLLRSKRLAFVTGSSLSRLQARRLTDREGVAWFSDLAEAERWLFDESRSASADVALTDRM